MKEFFDSLEGEFYDEYFELLINRITHSTMSLEKNLGDPDDSKNTIRLRDNIRSFKNLLVAISNNGCLSEELIIETANKINETSPYISNGYRLRGDHIIDTDIPISSTMEIKQDMEKLLYDYSNTWKDLDPFERESLFHINFIRIHPFEDGNGRTGRLLLNYNLLREKIAPVILTEDLNEYYQDYIKNKDYEEMANLFRIQSKKEQGVVHVLYDEYMNNNYSNNINKTR